MKHTRTRFLGLACLICLPIVWGCGTAPSPPSESSEAAEPVARAEAAPDISIAEQSLQVEQTVDPGIAVVRRYMQMFYAGEMEGLREKFSTEMKEDFPPGRLQVMRDRVRLNLGEEIEVVGEDSQTRDEYRGFVRWARFSKHDGMIEIRWILREDDTISGFEIREAQPDRQ